MHFHVPERSNFYHQRGGFSLVELLVVVCVTALLASISLLAADNFRSRSRETAAKRSAQQIVNVFASGCAAGVPSFVQATSLKAVQNAVGKGDYGAGALSGVFFKIEGVSENMDDGYSGPERCSYYMIWQDNTLLYKASGFRN